MPKKTLVQKKREIRSALTKLSRLWPDRVWGRNMCQMHASDLCDDLENETMIVEQKEARRKHD